MIKNRNKNMYPTKTTQTMHFVQRLRTAFWVLLLLLGVEATHAQQKPIDGSLQIVQPYPIYLKDFTSSINERVRLTLKSNEFWEAGQTSIRLKIVLEKGNSLIAQSDEPTGLRGVPQIDLYPNVPRLLTPAELSPYFLLANLQGINEVLYSEPLTEGVYRLSIYVYGKKSGSWTLMSDAISQQFWIVQNEPPLLNVPQNGDNIQTTLSENINFQWIPRAIQSAANTQYEFTLVQIPEGDVSNPYAIFLSRTPLLKRLMPVPSLSASAAEMRLVAGKTYAWRVQAKSYDLFNTEVVSYKNDGFSDIFTFRYSGSCAKPVGLTLEALASDLVSATWNLNTTYLSYRVLYRKYNPLQPFKWVEQEATNTKVNLTQLEPDTEYEVMVGGLCAANFLNYCDPVRIKTLPKDQIKGVQCGLITPLDLSNKNPIANLSPGDIIFANDFPINITRITGGSGNFTGEGYLGVPWIAVGPKIKVKFNGISVNTDKKLIAGVVETVYDPEWKGVLDADATFQQIKDAFQVLYDLILSSIDKDYSELTKMIDMMRESLASQLPEELKIRLEQALSELEAAKKAYDAARQQYNNATTDAERAAAQAAMNQAEQKFKAAQTKLDAVNKEKDQFIDDVVKILIKAIKEIRSQKYTDAKIETLKTTLTNKERVYDAALAKIEKSILPNGQVASALDASQTGAILLNIEEVSLDDFVQMDARTQFKQAEREYNRAVLIKAFASDANKIDAYKLLAKYLESNGENYVALITRKKKEGANEATLVNVSKDLITDFLETFLNRELKK
jgi:hypothetical protein